MNRTSTAPRVLALLTGKEYTRKELAETMGVPLSTVQGALNRLKAKGKVERRVDEDGYIHWKAKA